jgi:SAM-dependent methyltransferase
MRESDDKWTAGEAYDEYMGRWSRPLARAFLNWLGPMASAHWLEVGCGTGSLTSMICELAQPASVVACDPSKPFLDHAREKLSDSRATFVVVGADSLPTRDGGFEAIVSGLVLNFIPEPERALDAMRERAAPGGVIAAYVWNYSGGIEFLHAFWEEAVGLDPAAAALDEAQRFGAWQPPMLEALFASARLEAVEAGRLEVPTDFADFEDYWRPFLGGTGPAPSYVASLNPERREQLKERLRGRFLPGSDGSIRLRARASVVRGRAP